MLGTNHAACGAIAGLATYPLTGMDGPWRPFVWAGLWAGTALLCDWDHPKAAATQVWGAASEALTAGARALPGGHRFALHDPVLTTGAAWLITTALVTGPDRLARFVSSSAQAVLGRWITAEHLGPAAELFYGQLPMIMLTLAPLALLIGVCLKATVLPDASRATNLLVSTGIAAILTQHPDAALMRLLPYAVAGGVVVHILGDALTDRGVPVPIVWIWNRRATWGLPLFRVGHAFESVVVTPALSLTACWLAWDYIPSTIRAELTGALTLLTSR